MTSPEENTAPRRQRFPFVTVIATVLALFAFLLLTWLAYREGSPLGPPTPVPGAGEAQAAPNVEGIKARNAAALGGVGAKMSREEGRRELLKKLKTPDDAMPFPTPPPEPPPAPKKSEKEKSP